MFGNVQKSTKVTSRVEQLHDSFLCYQELMEQIAAVTYLSIPDEASSRIYTSPQIKKMSGHSAQEWLTDPSLWFRQLHPDDRDRVLAELHHCRESAEPFCSEYRLLDREERMIWVRDEAVVVYGKDGKAEYLQGLMRDITERKQAELALQDYEAKLRAIFSAIKDIILVLDAKGCYLEIAPTNPQLLYRPAYNLLGHTLTEVFPCEQADAFLAHISCALETKQTVQTEYALQVDGRELWFTAAISPMNEDKVVWVAHDITEHKRIEAEIQQRVTELDAVNKISTVLRTEPTLEKFLSRFLDETLAVLKTDAGILWLYDASQQLMKESVTRGWCTQLMLKPTHSKVRVIEQMLRTGETMLSEEINSDRRLDQATRVRIPKGWAGTCVSIRTTKEVVGLFFVSTQLPRKLQESEADFLVTMAEIAGNAIHRIRLHEQTKNQLARLTVLRTIDDAISSNLDLHVTVDVLLGQITTQLHLDAAAVWLMNKPQHRLERAAGRGFRSTSLARSWFRVGEGYAGKAALERRLIHIHDLNESGSSFIRDYSLQNEDFVGYYAAPLIAGEDVLGVLEIFHRTPLDAAAAWDDFLKGLASQAAIAIEKASLFEKLQRANLELRQAYEATIEGWSMALDLRDKETEGHTQRVTEGTLRLAKAMGLKDEELLHIRRGALLHDIGKMGVPDAILLKTNNLTEEETSLMHKHPQYAYDMLSRISYLQQALDIPYCHHEKWDGSGYPRGLKGKQIPLAARIFAVIDVYDALTSDRPYRKGWSEKDTIQYIREQSGHHFDPKVVELFLNVVFKN